MQDILDNIEAVREFIGEAAYEDFAVDQKTIYAVGRALEIISEASRRLPEGMRGRHPEIDWSALAGLGNVYRHDYDIVEADLMWQTVQRRLPALEAAVQAELQSLPEE